MESTAIVTRPSLENLFLVSLLLTGSVVEAEHSMVDSVYCSDFREHLEETLFRRLIRRSLERKPALPTAAEQAEGRALLPRELRSVLALPVEIRGCYVLRMLMRLSREVCSDLLQIDVAQLNQRCQVAMLALAEMHRGKTVVAEARHANLPMAAPLQSAQGAATRYSLHTS